MATCSIFHYNKTIPREERSLILILKDIQTGVYKEQIEKIRALMSQGKEEEAEALKFKLKSFSTSATFSERRLPEFLKMYNSHVHLDFDNVEPDQLDNAVEKATASPYTVACFISARGSGIKVLVEVDSNAENHGIAYQQVSAYYENLLGRKSDPRCKDRGRLCFMSYDPNLYKNLKNEKFKIEIPDTSDIPVVQVTALDHLNEPDLDVALRFHQQVEFTNKKLKFEEGNRNNYIHLLASNCNRAGIPQESTSELTFLYFNLPERELRATIQSVYRNQSHEFGKFAKSAKTANIKSSHNENQQNLEKNPEGGEQDAPDYLRSTPLIPDEICKKLPSILRDGAKVYTDKRKRDVFITGALAMLSGCLPKVTGVYFQERVYPHLNVFIIAPAANGKGALKNAKRLVEKYHDEVLKASREEMKKYETELLEYNDKKRKRKSGDPLPEPPQKPLFKIVLIPADCSHARLVEHLQNNGGHGIICETEADIMSGTKKQEWGDYSPLLRMAFHHEKYTYSRKTNDEYLEIEEPRIALGLSGTPGQVPKLIASAEDGLFSRILYYAYKSPIGWQDPSPRANPVVFNDHFRQLSEEVLKLTKHLDQFPTEVHLSDSQWDTLNSSFSNLLDDVVVFSSEDAAGVVYRLGLILFRFCMIFTALRKFEAGDMKQDCYCTDDDFESALALAKMYLQHSLLMLNNLPNQQDAPPFLDGENKRKFFDKLPQEFFRKDAIKLGQQFDLSARSVDEILKLALNTKLQKLKAGHYRKI